MEATGNVDHIVFQKHENKSKRNKTIDENRSRRLRKQIDRMFEDLKIDQEDLENCLTGIQKLENRSRKFWK